ncbi:MAG: NAD(P)H-binding protein [Pseudomonadota bacterium]
MNESPATIVLAGATGHIGKAVARELLAQQRPHTLLARSDLPIIDDALRATRTVDVTDPTSVRGAFTGGQVDTVISCLASRTGVRDDAWAIDHKANVHLLDAAKAAGVRHFVLLSAICVQKPELEFQRAKLAFERLLVDSGLTYSIVRPTAFFKSISGQVSRVLAGKPFLLFDGGNGTACKPMSESDLARFIVACIDDASKHNRILPIGGPGEAVTPRQQGELLFRLADRDPQFRSVPTAIFDIVATLLTPLGWASKSAAAKAELARIGKYYATESMLFWDERAQRYDADATPSYGKVTLEQHYAHLLSDGIAGYEAGEQRLF